MNGPELSADIKDKVIAIVEQDEDTKKWEAHCAGVWISPTEIMTANHCTTKEIIPGLRLPLMSRWVATQAQFDAQAPVQALVVRRETARDLAVLQVKDVSPHGYAEFRQGTVPVGEEVYVVGQPWGDLSLPWTVTRGIVSGIRPDFRDLKGEILQTDATIWYGNSGGGMFDHEGRLVGIASEIDVRSKKYGFFVRVTS
jgi:S1-C subfamily serine protease